MEEPETVSLLDSLEREWLKLPEAAMVEVGSATQTLGGLLNVTTRETYCSVGKIAQAARLPVTTARKHLAKLARAGWIDRLGRQRTRAGWLRRTCTIRISKKARDRLEPYGFLPWWACCRIRKVGELSWSAKAVLAVVMARICSLKAVIVEQDGCGLDADDMIGSIENMGGDERFRFSLRMLKERTGLSRNSIRNGVRLLRNAGVIVWAAGGTGNNGEPRPSILLPNWNFGVLVTPAGQGRCYLAFDRTAFDYVQGASLVR